MAVTWSKFIILCLSSYLVFDFFLKLELILFDNSHLLVFENILNFASAPSALCHPDLFWKTQGNTVCKLFHLKNVLTGHQTLCCRWSLEHTYNTLCRGAKSTQKWYYLPTPPLGQDMTQGQFF